jgi:hypothetical protein
MLDKFRHRSCGRRHCCTFMLCFLSCITIIRLYSSSSVLSLSIQGLLAFLLDLSLFPIGLTHSWCSVRELKCRSPELGFAAAVREPLVRLQRPRFDFERWDWEYFAWPHDRPDGKHLVLFLPPVASARVRAPTDCSLMNLDGI